MCGIGGNTIEEAQRKLSFSEFQSWAEYRDKRGSLHIGMRVERASALLAVLMANRYRKDGVNAYKLHDFAPNMDVPEEKELTLEDLKGWS